MRVEENLDKPSLIFFSSFPAPGGSLPAYSVSPLFLCARIIRASNPWIGLK